MLRVMTMRFALLCLVGIPVAASACGETRRDSVSPAQQTPPRQASPAPGAPVTPALPPGAFPPGPVLVLGFMGMTFYPGSVDKQPGVTPGPGSPSVRLTSDTVAQVAGFYRPRLGNTLKELKVTNAVVLDGLTPSGPVRITIEPFEGRTQVTIAHR